MNKILVSLYTPIDAFPPTINLINEFFSKQYEVYGVEIAEKSFKHSSVKLNELKTLNSPKHIPRLISNYVLFFRFLLSIFKLSKKNKIKNHVVFDSYSLLTFFILKSFRLINKKSKVWYHNHDVGYSNDFPVFSLGWLVYKLEPFINRHTDFFTLPSKERGSKFLTRNCDFILPNYPAIKIYKPYQSNLKGKVFSLIFQGRISPGHGFESIIKLLTSKVNGFSIELVFKGIVSDAYKDELLSGIESEVLKKISFIGYTDYEQLPKITSNSHIGIAIHRPNSFMHATLGTASNKIYEYIACGLPILYYDNEHFNYYLEKYSWAFPVSDNPDSILIALNKIMCDYDKFSIKAKDSFMNELNYESYFDQAFQMFKKQ
jgi:hypothetical protein